jgi:predicted hotdog family 3-hydroxylacyl-ACP dehydratase
MQAPLDHAAIEARIPHRGAMCLLARALECDERRIRCLISDAADPAHPLRGAHGLPAAAALEIASQAMALHGSLNAERGAGGAPAAPSGFLASARQLRLHVALLDDAPPPIEVCATLHAGNPRQALYGFELRAADGRLLVDGRAVVVLDGAFGTPP